MDRPTFPLPAGSSIAPGLIDLHTNGAGEFLFNRDQGNAIGVAGASYAANGATGFVAGVMTAPWESMLHAASELWKRRINAKRSRRKAHAA